MQRAGAEGCWCDLPVILKQRVSEQLFFIFSDSNYTVLTSHALLHTDGP